MATMAKKKSKHEDHKKLLLSKREELIKRLYERRAQIAIDRDPDDEGALAVQDVVRELSFSNMEREIRTLAEVEFSLRLLDNGKYGICGSCGAEIAPARLHALPWARICVTCAGGGIMPATQTDEEEVAKEMRGRTRTQVVPFPKRRD